MCEKISHPWDVSYLTTPPVIFFVEKDTILDVAKCIKHCLVIARLPGDRLTKATR